MDPCCVASLVLSIGSLLVLALPLGMSAVVVGIVGLERRGRGAALAWWGIGIGALATSYGLWKSGLRLF